METDALGRVSGQSHLFSKRGTLRLSLPRLLVTVLGAFAPMFSPRVFAPVTRRLVGAILAPGQRTLTAVLRVMGRRDDAHVQTDHRVLSRAQWPARRGARRLWKWLGRACVPTAPVVIGIDDTMARRRSEKIAAQGLDRAPVSSAHAPFVNASGWPWVSLMLLAPVPWTPRVWGRPLLTVLSPSERYDQYRGCAPRTLLDRARQAGRRVHHGLPERALIVVGDAAYAALEWLAAVRHAIWAIPRLRLDAAL